MDLELVCIGLFALCGCVFFIIFLACFQTPDTATHINSLGDHQDLAHTASSSLPSADVDEDGLPITHPVAPHHPAPGHLSKSTLAAAGQYSSNLYFMKRLSRSLTAERSAHIMPCILREFSVAEMEAATAKFSSSNMLKHGHSGDIFKGLLEGGEIVVIKRVMCMHKSKDRQDIVDGNNATMIRDYYAIEMDVYGKVLDQTFLVPVLGQCLASQEEKYLVYAYMPQGDLATILAKGKAHAKKPLQKPEMQPQLNRQEVAEIEDDLSNVYCNISNGVGAGDIDGNGGAIWTWPVRMRIARQVAEALVYLHHENRPPLSHRNIQGSSILLNKYFEVKLGSLGDAQKIESGELPVYDIYCFGRLLLDLISGLDVSGNGRDEDVQAWISMCFHALNSTSSSYTSVPHLAKEPDINNVFKDQLIDRYLVPLLQEHHLLEMIQVAHLAKLCMEPTTLQKLSMKEVLALLPAPWANYQMP